MVKIKVIVPTFNAGERFLDLVKSLKCQQKISKSDIIIVDSSSSDDTVAIAKKNDFHVTCIPKGEFGHGKTRKFAVTNNEVDYIVFLTQDVVLEKDTSIIDLVKPLELDPNIGIAYGRQLPTESVDIFGKFARLFNYPEKSILKTQKDIAKLGIKATFCSDSFAAYNRKNLLDIGNFQDVDFGEDALAAATFLLKGYSVYYYADACVYHAHQYTLYEEFKRYWAVGRFHKQQCKILSNFPSVNGEGLRYVINEMRFLFKEKQTSLLFYACLKNVCKFLGYKLGKL